MQKRISVERLAALRSFGVLDTAPEPIFDELTGLAARTCRAPMALLAIEDGARLWLMSRTGLEARELPGAPLPCGVDTLVVEDARRHKRLKTHPLVLASGARLLAAAPLHDGALRVGSLAVIDRRVRTLTEPQRDTLRVLARQAMRLLEARRKERALEARISRPAPEGPRVAFGHDELFAAITDGSSDAIFLKDREGHYKMINRAGAALLGRTVAQVLGRTDRELVPPDVAARTRKHDLAAMRRGVITYETTGVHGGALRIFQSTKGPWRDPQGNVVGVFGISRDHTDRKRVEEELGETTQTLQATLRASPLAVITVDLDLAVRSWNPAAEQLFGLSASRALGNEPPFLGGKEGTRFRELWRRTLQGQPAMGVELRHEQKGCAPLDVTLWTAPLRDAQGHVRGALGLLADRRERRELEEERARLQQEALRAREDVLAIVSHDLRNPLGSILATSASLLKELPQKDKKAHQGLGLIERCARRMNRLVEDLLDLAQIEAGGLRIEPVPFPVGALLDDALANHAAVAAQKGLILSVGASCEEARVLCDHDRALQVLGNLIGNAIKYTGAGGSIQLRAAPMDEEVHFSVADTGRGIPPAALPQLFEPYWQAHRAREGVGLGLFIARGLVAAHRGRIWMESEPGKGTVAHFTLPRE